MAMEALQREMANPKIRLLAPLLAVLGVFMLGAALAKPVQIELDGKLYQARLFGGTVADVFRELGWRPQPEDSINREFDEPLNQINSPILMRRAKPVLLQLENSTRWIETASTLPANLLQALDIILLPGDQIWVDGLPYSPEAGPLAAIPARIHLKKAANVNLRTNGTSTTIRAQPSYAESVLSASGRAIYEGDEIEMGGSTESSGLPRISWQPSQPVRFDIAGKQVRARVAAQTVGDALGQAGVALLGLDYTEPAVSKPVPQNRPIQVTRVREEVMVELEPVPFETQYQPLADVEIDNKRVIETGSYGVRADQVRIRYENGEEVNRSVEGNWLAREPEPRVIGYGTNIVVRSTSTADGPIEYWRAVEMWATSYSPSRAGVPDDYEYFGITASGKPLRKGLVAIDRSLIPFGTQMYVPGYGFAEAADTGGGVKGLWIDLGYEDDNWQSWSQYVTVYFLTPVPPAGSITYILP